MKNDTKKREDVKGFVEKLFDNMLKGDIVTRLGWVTQVVPLSDLRDVAIGYVIGVTLERLKNYGLISEILDGSKLISEDYDNTMAVFKEKLPQIIEKIEKEFSE